jgi:hypothetical protein
MHVTLSRWANVGVALLWALVLVATLHTTRPFPAVEFILGLLLGLAAGHLQDRAISARPREFLAAQSAQGVRRAMVAVASGKASILLMWLNGVGLLIWAMAFAPDMFLGAWLSGIAAFGLAREVAAFPAVVRLAHLQGAVKEHGQHGN